MSDVVTESAMSRLTAIILSLLLIMVVGQSVFLFMFSRDLRRERAGKDVTAIAAAAEGRPSAACREKAEREEGDAAGTAAEPPALRRYGWLDDPDEFWQGLDREKWNPFSEFQRMRERVNHLFDDSFSRFSQDPTGGKKEVDARVFSPSLDLQEKDDSYVARMDIPGADKPKLSVTMKDRLLTVSGQITEFSERKEGDHVLRKERRSGNFQRSVTLPGAVVADAMTAHYENGVLTITLPKAKENADSKTIQVQ